MRVTLRCFFRGFQKKVVNLAKSMSLPLSLSLSPPLSPSVFLPPSAHALSLPSFYALSPKSTYNSSSLSPSPPLVSFSLSHTLTSLFLLGQPYGPAVDMWAMGVIAYVVLVGFPPFDGENDV